MIECHELTKEYGSFKAVDNIDLIAEDGEITVLLGPNGAGKSTTIKSIVGLLQFEGKIKINGFANKTENAKRSFGYIPEAPVLYDMLTIDEHLNFIASAYQIKDYKELAERYYKLFDLGEKRKNIVKNLSKGMKQKVSMMLALILSPKVLLVDEPMVGLDPASIEEVLKLLVELKDEGVAVLISTHIIDVVDEIWDKAYIMNKGKIVHEVHRKDLETETLKEIFFKCTGDHHENDL